MNLDGYDTFIDCRGRASGKTYCATSALLPEFFTTQSRFAFGAVTEKRGRSGWKEIVDYCKAVLKLSGGKGWRFAPADDGLMESPSGGMFEKISLDGPDAGRGNRYHGAIFDELQLVREETFQNFLPTLSVLQGVFIGLCTAPKTAREWSHSQWWIQKIIMEPAERAEKYPNWHIVHKPTTAEDLAFLTKQKQLEFGREERSWDYYMMLGHQQLERLRREMSPAVYAREIEVRLVKPDSGLVFKSFGPKNVSSIEVSRARDMETIVGLDKGGGSAESVALAIKVYSKNVRVGYDDLGNPLEEVRQHYHVYAEYHTKEMISSSKLVYEANKIARDNGWIAYPDPRAPDVHLELSMRAREMRKTSVPIIDSLELIDGLFHQEVLTIDPSCKQLISQLEVFSYNDDGEPQDDYNDTIDALRYAIYNHRRYEGLPLGVGQTMGEDFDLGSDPEGGAGFIEL